MDEPAQKPARFRRLAADAVMTLSVFAFFTWVLTGHVPSNNPFDIWFWAAVGSSCMSAVFWLGLQMFRVVLDAQRAEKKS